MRTSKTSTSLKDRNWKSRLKTSNLKRTASSSTVNASSKLKKRKKLLEDGLAHISELDYSRVEKVEDAVNIGDKVQVKILDVDPEQERISLSLKQAQESPFSTFVNEHSEGDVLEGTVKRLVKER